MSRVTKPTDLTPTEVKAGLDERKIFLIDVREPTEFAAERIHGALNFPLSTFDPDALPKLDEEKTLVLQCGSGKRSAMAVDRCLKAGHAFHQHMAGGISAWKAQGLPTITIDAATGAVRDRS